MSQLQQQTQATDIQEEEIKTSVNIPYVESTIEKLLCILISHKIRSTQIHHFCVRKALLSIITLISHIAQLLLICKFYCFHLGLNISFKYVWHNYLSSLKIGEVSLETKLCYILAHDVINLLNYEHWTDKRKYFYINTSPWKEAWSSPFTKIWKAK